MLKIKTKHRETKPNQWLKGLHLVENDDGRRELRNDSGHLVTVHKSGPYAEFKSTTDNFALWITQAQFDQATELLAAE